MITVVNNIFTSEEKHTVTVFMRAACTTGEPTVSGSDATLASHEIHRQNMASAQQIVRCRCLPARVELVFHVELTGNDFGR